MANVIDLSRYAGHARETGILSRLRAAYEENRRFRALRSELNALSDRDLNDIGIARASIDRIAREGAHQR